MNVNSDNILPKQYFCSKILAIVTLVKRKKLIKNFFKHNFVDDLSNFLFDYHLLEEKRNGSCFNAQNANFS